jgi:hypothetical protein
VHHFLVGFVCLVLLGVACLTASSWRLLERAPRWIGLKGCRFCQSCATLDFCHGGVAVGFRFGSVFPSSAHPLLLVLLHDWFLVGWDAAPSWDSVWVVFGQSCPTADVLDLTVVLHSWKLYGYGVGGLIVAFGCLVSWLFTLGAWWGKVLDCPPPVLSPSPAFIVVQQVALVIWLRFQIPYSGLICGVDACAACYSVANATALPLSCRVDHGLPSPVSVLSA